MIGSVVSDRYKILKYLGGGMSSVYLAEDIILQRNVVVKLIKVDHNDLDKSKLRFQREVQSTTQLSHPNIVNVLDVDETNEYQLLVTEVVNGPTLKEYISNNHPIDIHEIVELSIQILNGIKHAHHTGIIHRDIKPQNILLDENHQVKITDFGIAKALSETRMTETNQVMGSVQYISPEQAKGQSTDERTDIYSFGILLFEMLTGALPFSGETPVSVALKHISEDIPDIAQYRVVPQGIKNIVLRCTEKKTMDRFRQVDDIIIALDDYKENDTPYIAKNSALNDEDTVVTQPPAEPDTSSEFSEEDKEPAEKKKKRWPWLIPLLLILAAMAIMVYLWFVPGEERSNVTLPDLQELTQDEAEAELVDHGLMLGDVNEEYHDEIEEGMVIETVPDSGDEVSSDTPVDLIVSQGEEPHEMEDYVGETYENIQEAVNQIGFNAVTIEESYDDSEPGTIISQSIEEGEMIDPEEEDLTLEISQGIEPIEVTNYTGESLEDATNELESLGFNVSVIQEVYHDDIEEGDIISQDPSYGYFLPGSTINMVVSLGEESAMETQYVQTVQIPYPEDEEENSEDDNDPEPAEVEIYLGDRDNDIDEVFDSSEITEDTSYTIRLVIDEDSEGEFKIDVNGETFMEETIPYEGD